MHLFTLIFANITTLSSIVGIVGFFFSPTITIVCAAISLINSIIQVIWGDQTNIGTEIATIFVGIIIALIFHLPIINTIAIALCIVEAIIGILGYIQGHIMMK